MTALSRRSQLLLDAIVLLITVVTTVRFNNPVLRLADFEPQIRLGLFAAIGCATTLALIIHPMSLRPEMLSGATKWLIALAGVAIVSTAWSPDPARTASQAVASASFVLAITLHANELGWQRSRALMARGLLALLAMSAALELAVVRDVERWEGLAGAATQLAQVSVLAAALTLAGFIRHRESVLFTSATLIFCTGLIIMSQSRAPLAVIVALVALAAFIRTPKTARVPALFGTISTVFVSIILAQDLLVGLALRDNAKAGDLTELTGRSQIWPTAIDVIKESPWVGHGFASGQLIWAREVITGSSNWYPTHAHQIILEVLMSLGIVGLVCLAAFVIAIFLKLGQPEAAPAILLVITVFALGATEAMVHYASPAIAVLALSGAAFGRTPRGKRLSVDPQPLLLATSA